VTPRSFAAARPSTDLYDVTLNKTVIFSRRRRRRRSNLKPLIDKHSLYYANCSPWYYDSDGEGADRNSGQSTTLTCAGNLFLFFICRYDGEMFRVLSCSGWSTAVPSNFCFLAYRYHNTQHVRVTLSQYTTCMRNTITIHNMYA
jgi:hypothetical protein